MKKRAVAVWALRLTVALGAPGIARADEPVAKNTLAIEKGKAAIALYEQGQWERALGLFREADALYHSPVLSVYIARSLRNLGRLLEAREVCGALRTESIPTGAPPTWQRAQLDCAAEAKALDAEIPSVVVEAAGATPAARAAIDGKPVALGVVEVDPGEHRVTVEDGGRVQAAVVTLRKGERGVRVAFGGPPRGAVAPSSGEPGPWRNLGVVATAVGGAAFLTGSILGAVALAKSGAAKGSLPPGCDAKRSCPETDRPAIDRSFASAFTFADVADVLLVGGGIVAAGGLTLWIADPGGGKPAASASPAASVMPGLRGATLRLGF